MANIIECLNYWHLLYTIREAKATMLFGTFMEQRLFDDKLQTTLSRVVALHIEEDTKTQYHKQFDALCRNEHRRDALDA